MPQNRESVSALERDLRGIFGPRFHALVIYGLHAAELHAAHTPAGGHHHEASLTHTLALVETLTAADLRECAGRVSAWHDAGLATPLLLAGHEFERSLDAFPYEFGEILADHVAWTGTNPFDGLKVDPDDLRRACEAQARSHLLHLREGYVETGGNANGIAVLIVRSAAPFGALVRTAARLLGSGTHDTMAAGRTVEQALGLHPGVVTDVLALIGVREMPSPDAVRMFPLYLDAVEKLTTRADEWSAR